MRIRSFIIAYALLLAILLFADRRPNPAQQNRYSHIVDLTVADATGKRPPQSSRTQIIAPDALIPGTWTAGQIPPERLVAPLVVMDLNVAPPAQISLDDVANWEAKYGSIPQGAVVAIRNRETEARKTPASASLPITDGAAQFLMDARYTLGFAVESTADVAADRPLARQLALHGNYVLEKAGSFSSIPATGSLIIVAPAKEKSAGTSPVRVLAMVR